MIGSTISSDMIDLDKNDEYLQDMLGNPKMRKHKKKRSSNHNSRT